MKDPKTHKKAFDCEQGNLPPGLTEIVQAYTAETGKAYTDRGVSFEGTPWNCDDDAWRKT